ncbi:sugar kinase [Lysobacter sp. K5869]|uniref:sugar kinase n=1 Tax=Lysobacter sp. K5869 TaxID=2820808 RepID=UPI001C05ED8E|nr:sugar kinase [Lysobacter sp. K5869]QWP75280.1 sugar kinase [Lysobacter sp. K5869]
MKVRVVCFGELLLRLGAPGRERLLQRPQLDVHVGGAEANVAVSLAQLGHEAVFASVVADNELGGAALGELRRHGVDTSAVLRAPGRMGLYFLETGALQRPSRVLYDRSGSAFERARSDDYDWPTLLRGSAWLHLSGVTPAVGQAAADAALAGARTARQLGVKVCFDGNFRASLWERRQIDPAPVLRQLMAEADMLLADHRDIDVVLGHEPSGAPDETERLSLAASRAFQAFPHLQTLACTRRAQRNVDHHTLSAVLVRRDGSWVETRPLELASIVDRIGAGDAFAAGLLHATLRGMSDPDALGFALAAAGLKHSLPGDFNPVGEAEVLALRDGAGFHVRR